MLDGREIGSCRAGRTNRLHRKYIGRRTRYCKKYYGKETYSREKMKPRSLWDTNWLQDNPLKNFLKSKIGKNWDDVYSELVKRKLPLSLMSWLDFYVEKTYDNINDTTGRRLDKGDLYICCKTKRLMEK